MPCFCLISLILVFCSGLYNKKGGVIKLFEIKKTSSSNKTIRMPDSMIEKLERLAAKNDISFNQLVIQCCEYAIENLVSQN